MKQTEQSIDSESDYIVVIRSSNERTEALCKKIVQKEAFGRQVVMVHEKPFKKALEKGFQLAIEAGTKWLITVDADMLVLPGAFKELHRQAESMPEQYFQLQGRIMDKISGEIRKAGPRIYRVSLLSEALRLSETYEDSIRPEALIVGNMGKTGHPSRYISYVTCLHDYEQFYKDLYRKSFVHARKHEEFVSSIIQWSVRNLKKDPDFKVILKALWDGLMYNDVISIDTRMFSEKAEKALSELEMDEKASIPDNFSYHDLLETEVTDKILQQKTAVDFHDQPVPDRGYIWRLKRSIKQKGFLDSFRSALGSFLTSAGNRIKN
jgi:hypothetical protein